MLSSKKTVKAPFFNIPPWAASGTSGGSVTLEGNCEVIMAYDLIKISALPAATPDESQDIVVGVGDYAKRINYNAVKADMVGTEPLYTTDTEPYLMRRTAHVGVVGKCALNKLVGGSLGWNQLVANGNFESTSSWTARQSTISVANNIATVTPSSSGTERGLQSANYLKATAGHKYVIKVDVNSPITSNVNLSFGGANAIARAVTASAWVAASCVYEATVTATTALYALIAGTTTTSQTIQYRNAMSTDLTLDFGSTIADYVYGLEQATAGAGVAWLSKYIDLGTYHAYDAGSIQSVQATEHVTTGFNQFDEVVESGYWDVSTGQKASGGSWMRCANYIPVLPNTEYKIHFTSGSGSQGSLVYLDGNKSVISYISSYISTVITTPSNCRYIVFYANNGWFGGNICINISKTSGTPKNGDYVPYDGHSYPLDSTKEFRGIFKLDASNNLYAEGDIYYPSGVVDENYNIVDLGTLNYASETSVVTGLFRCTNTPSDMKYIGGLVCSKYIGVQRGYYANLLDGEISVTNGEELPQLRIRDVSKASLTDAQFKTAMSGIYLVYEKKTASTSTADPYQKIQTIDADGTESFTTSSPVPVGHETQTPDNILAALGWLGE